MDSRPTAVVLDDHPAIVAGVTAWCLAADPPIEVVDAEGRLSRVWTGAGGAADVVVLDLQLGEQPPAFAEIERLVDVGRTVVVYSQRQDSASALTCLELGASTYLTKAEGREHLVPAIHAVWRGEQYVSPLLAGTMGADDRPGRPVLSSRETEVLIAWFACASKRHVAEMLNLSVSTVETYIDRVRQKYSLAGRSASTKAVLVERALQDGIISLPPAAGGSRVRVGCSSDIGGAPASAG